jgi:threonine dehydrogenase-like Zn-dependent dehydrogenase
MLLGAERVIAIDSVFERLEMARLQPGVEVLNEDDVDDVTEALRDLTGGRGPDACIDAVGMEAHGHGLEGLLDTAKYKLMLQNDRPIALRQAINACRKGGTVSIPGVYGGLIDKFPIGAAFGKGLTLKMGQTHVQKYIRPLLDRVERGEIDPSFVITHRLPLGDAPRAYEIFNDKEDGCIKVVLNP